MASLNTTVQDTMDHQAKKMRVLEPPNKDQQRKLLFSEHQSDVVFKVGNTGELIHAHKSIITLASEVFSAQFYGDFAESKRDNLKNPVVIEDIQPRTFKEVLRYIYCGEANITAINAIDIYYASEKYMLTGLKEKVKLFLKSSVDEDNVLLFFNKNRQHKIDFVDEICLKIIRDNPLACFQSKYFLTLSQPALELIAASRTMKCQKEQLCEAIKEWCEFNNSAAEILPKWESMPCRKLRSFSSLFYSNDGSTDFTINVKKKLYLHGLGVVIGKPPHDNKQTVALVKVAVNQFNPFNVFVSQEICFKEDLYVQEIVFKRLTVTDECRIRVTVETTTGGVSKKMRLYCFENFQPVETKGTEGLIVKHNSSAHEACLDSNRNDVSEIYTNYVEYLLFDVD